MSRYFRSQGGNGRQTEDRPALGRPPRKMKAARAIMLGMVKRDEPYSDLRALAKPCHCLRSSVKAAIDSNRKLKDWQLKGRRSPGPSLDKREAARQTMLAMLERGEPCPPLSVLARSCHCTPPTVRFAINSDRKLKDWRARARRPAGLPPKKTQAARVIMLGMIDRSEAYPERRTLARLCHCSLETVRRAINSDEKLRTWWLRGRFSKKKRELLDMILGMIKRGEPYQGLRDLAKRCTCPSSRVQTVFSMSEEARRWRARNPRPRGWHSHKARARGPLHRGGARPAMSGAEALVAPAPPALPTAAPVAAVANDGYISITDAQVAAGFRSYKALTKFLADHPVVSTFRPLSVRTGKPDPHRRMVDIAMLFKTKKAEDERADHVKEELEEEVADRSALEREAKAKAKASVAKHVPLGSRAT